MIDRKNITGIVLAGGKSSRMGTDKGLINHQGQAFVWYSISALEPLVSRILLVSNKPQYDIFRVERIEDLFKEAGPLAGIYTGLHHSTTDYNLVLSCDIPLITTEILQALIGTSDENIDVVQIVSEKQPMPLIALYHKRCKTLFHERLQNNEYRLQVALEQCNVRNVVLDSDKNLFTSNINTPQELKKLGHEAHH